MVKDPMAVSHSHSMVLGNESGVAIHIMVAVNIFNFDHFVSVLKVFV